VAWVDEHVVGLRYQHRSDYQYCSVALREPAVAPCPRDRDSTRPIGWQRRLVNRSARHFIRDFQFDEMVSGECLWLPHFAVNEDFEYGRCGIRRAIENFSAPRVPSTRCKQSAASIERGVLGESPDDHPLTKHAVLDAEQ